VVQVTVPDIHQYNNSDLSLKEKIDLVTWHHSLLDHGVMGMMVNSLEMIVKFSKNCERKNHQGATHMTSMDGLTRRDPDNPSDVMNYGLILLLMCLPRATDKKLKSLDNFLNGPDFFLGKICPCHSKYQRKFIKWECKTKIYIQQAFQEIKHGSSARKIPTDAHILKSFDGIGMQIALLGVQFVYQSIQACFTTNEYVVGYCYCISMLIYLENRVSHAMFM